MISTDKAWVSNTPIRRRISRSLVTILALGIFQFVGGLPSFALITQPPVANATVGSGACASTVTDASASAVEVVSVTNYCVLKFKSGSNSWTAPVGVNSVRILIVGGGGAGGTGRGGGGGAGGIYHNTNFAVSNTSYAITVGAGGVANTGNVSGGQSIFDSLTINGGGAGGAAGASGVSTQGASGGGAGMNYGTTYPVGGTSTSQTLGGISVLGYSGGQCDGTSLSCIDGVRNTGGGGGAGGVGKNGSGGTNTATGGNAPDGGAGVSNDITGTATTYACGGGGAAGIHYGEYGGALYKTAAKGVGGCSTAGTGGYPTSTTEGVAATAGTANYGGGGGGGSDAGGAGGQNSLAGGSGGSGVIIIRWIPTPTFTAPGNPSVPDSHTTTLTVTENTSSTLTITRQWQRTTDGGSTWSNVTGGSGATTLSYTTPTLSAATSTYTYRMTTTYSDGVISSIGYTTSIVITMLYPPGSDTDTALTFSSTSQYASAPDDNAFDVTGAITMEAWVKPTSLPASGFSGMVVQKSGAYELMMSNVAGTTTWQYGLWGTSAWNGVSTGIPVVINEWHHIAFTRDAGSNTVNFYYDGVLVKSDGGADTVSTGNINNSAYPFSIGVRYTNGVVSGDSFTGTIDQVAIFNTARSTTNVQSDMNNYLSPSTSGLVALYDFNEGSGTKLYNRVIGSTTATDLTVAGTPSWSDVKSVDTTTLPAYTIVKFPRSYITKIGGWKVPSQVSRAYALVLAGGGGGGGGLNGGGGGAGGFIESLVTLTPSGVQPVTVGVGGIGYLSGSLISVVPSNGTDSIAFGLSAVGGGYGASELYSPNSHYAANSGGSGGGGSWGNNSANYAGKSGTNNQGFAGGNSGSLSSTYAGAGGGGAGSVGGNATVGNGGNGGTGKFSLLLNETLAGGGGGACRNGSNVSCTGGIAFNGGGSAASGNGLPNTTNGAKSGTANTGGGGGGGVFQNSNADGKAGSGGSGIVAIRWITATKPTFTRPATAYLDVGQTETFTVNVASDSATVNLIRTFKWESSTTGANGTFTKIKEGTGAANAFFSWIPPDTSTSGANFVYRVTVTDSDTAGLFITDSATAYAIINRAMVITPGSGSTTIAKTINVSRDEPFTITLGTPTYSASMSPVIAGITLETTTATTLNVKIGETVTVGTYYETITVIDSVSATITLPLTLIVAAPPSLLNTGEIVAKGLVLNIDAGNSASIIAPDNTAITNLSIKDLSGSQKNGQTSSTAFTAGTTTQTCNAPTYRSDYGGYLDFSGSAQCVYVPYLGQDFNKSVTVEVWARTSTTINGASYVTQMNPSKNISFNLGATLGANTNARFSYQPGSASTTHYTGIESVTANIWKHLVGTYDGSNLILYQNGVAISTTADANAGLDTSGTYTNTAGYLIGAGFTSGKYLTGAIASVRIYNRALSSSEVSQNYNSTKERFTSANVNFIKPTYKYGNSLTDSFTATSGYGVTTIAPSVGDKQGLTWDLSTTSKVTFNAGQDLPSGYSYDTITVTDSLGASTYLPLRISVTKADTLTIYLDTNTVMTYNGKPATVLPTVQYSGLAGNDSFSTRRLFTSSTYAETATVPTNADTYTVRAETATFAVGDATNYINVVYETRTLTINKAKQSPLNIFLYGGTVGSGFAIQLMGGNGDGVVTETLTGISSLTGCSISNHFLYASEQKQGYCEVRVVKEASQNYLSESSTVQMYFMAFVNSQPTGQMGSGSTIALNGSTSFTIDTTAPPTITGLSWIDGYSTVDMNTGQFRFIPSHWELNGSGFGSAYNTNTVVKFWRNKEQVSGAANSGQFVSSDTSIWFTSYPSGVTPGRIVVITPNGEAVSSFNFTPPTP